MMQKNHKKIVGAFLGTIVEYYDYSLYGFSAGILADKFFPSADKMSGLMYVFAVYALSYFAKPFGSLFFSKLGDKYGRYLALQITMLGIAIPTLIIGILPEYSFWGIITTQVLIICRFFQGFFAGGEYDGAAIYVIEHLGEKYQYTASAITRATGVIGLLLGIASTNFFNSSIFPEWGWRIPFLLSLPLAMIAMHYRKFLEETPVFISSKQQGIEFSNIFIFIKNNWVTLIWVIMLAGGFGVTYQISIVFIKQYLPLVMPSSSNIISSFSTIIVLCFGIAMPFAGLLADRFGHSIIILISLLLTLLCCFGFAISVYYNLLNLALVSCMLLAASVAPFNALAHGIIIKAFKAKERYRGVGFGHTIGSLLMSGTANYICLFFMKNYHFALFPILYVAIFALVTYITTKKFSE